MHHLKTLGLIGLLLVLFLYVGIKAYIHFNVKGGLDEAIAGVRAFVEIDYQDLSTDLTGGLALEGLRLHTQDGIEALRINTVRLEGPGLGFLFDAAAGFKDNRMPHWLELSLEKMMVLDPQGLARMQAGVAGAVPRVDPQPCTLSGLMQRIGTLDAGQPHLLMDLHMGYRLESDQGTARVMFDYAVEGGESLSMQTDLSGLLATQALMQGRPPSIERLSVTLYPARHRMLEQLAGCAEAQGLSPADYLDRLLGVADAALGQEFGAIPGPGLRAALKRLLLDPQELQLVTGPIEDPMRLAEVSGDPQRLLQALDVQLLVNGQVVDDLRFSDYVEPAQAVDSTASTAKAQVRQPEFIATPVSELPGFLGRRVKLQAAGHPRPHIGYLVSAQDNEVIVEKRINSGKLSVHVPFEDIRRIEVLRFADEEED